MKDRQQNTWTAVTVYRPDQLTAHHHYITPPKWSLQHSESLDCSCRIAAKRSLPIFGNEHLPKVKSVPTGRTPLTMSGTQSTPTSQPSRPQLSFTEKYGRCLEILHYGSNSTVRLHQRKTFSRSQESQLLAIKVYRHDILNLSNSLARGSFCSPATIADLHPSHPNILPITELLCNERAELCLVMPYCAGGNLHELLSRTGPLPTVEADCLVAQILRALYFLHTHNTAHRDIRLETVLLTQRGSVKLAGFGDEHIRRLWSDGVVMTETREEDLERSPPPSSISSSFAWVLSAFSRYGPARRASSDSASSSASFPGMVLPYIPPEGFRPRSHRDHYGDDIDEDEGDDDPRPADVWATAIVYFALLTGRLVWRSARPDREDTRYLEYLDSRRGEDGYPPIEALGQVSVTNLACVCFLQDDHIANSDSDDVMLSTPCCIQMLGDGLQQRICCGPSGLLAYRYVRPERRVYKRRL